MTTFPGFHTGQFFRRLLQKMEHAGKSEAPVVTGVLAGMREEGIFHTRFAQVRKGHKEEKD